MTVEGMFYEKDRVFTDGEKMATARESLIFNLTEDLLIIMEDKGVSKTELATRLGKSKAYITQILSGSRNMTLNTFADLCFVLDVKPNILFDELNFEIVSEDIAPNPTTVASTNS